MSESDSRPNSLTARVVPVGEVRCFDKGVQDRMGDRIEFWMSVVGIADTPRFLDLKLVIHLRNGVGVVAVPGEGDAFLWRKSLAPYGGNEPLGL